jgi:regulator of sirC expression with transglutaminase-like and TPR domain
MTGALQAFCAAVRAPEPEIDLARATLLLARVEHPELSPAPTLRRLDELAEASGAADIDDRLHALHRLREFLCEEEGFRGNTTDYYDPRNSCLNDVLDRHLGIPITLSVVFMEVGRRVGLHIRGVGLPGHFVVRADVGPEPVLLDPFDGGAVLTHERAAEVVARAVGRSMPLTEEHFAPVGKRQVVTRMLLNLRGIYCARGEWSKALTVVEHLLVVDEDCAGHVRDRGTVLVKLGHLQQGVTDWERYLGRCPQAADAEKVRGQLREVRQRLAALN